MSSAPFRFKQFTIHQERSAFKVGTDGVLLGAWANIERSDRILDIGSGTGLIALMLAQRSTAAITAIEPDEPSYEEALRNVANSPWSDRITLIRTSLNDFVSAAPERFDHIVSNPPFFKNLLKNPDIRQATARHAVTMSYTDILNSCSALLGENGQLSLVLPYAEGSVAIAEAATLGLYCNRMVKIKATPSSEVLRLLLSFSTVRTELATSFMVIESHGRHRYSKEYIELTRDYYLKM